MAIAILLGADSSGDPVALCERIRALANPRAKETPVIVLTEDGSAGDDSSKAVTEWLSRPFSMQYARARIRAWLTRSICRWRRASLPEDEERRLRGLQGLAILDTSPEERFDCHTRIAAAALDVPIALVTLVDRERQWFKSRQGLDVSQTPRDMAFCAHAILADEPFIVTDALTDDRFADNPLVVNDPRVRFYAGVPLHIADGSRVGTLCIIDHKPRDLSATQLDLLKDLAKLVEQELQSPE
jgi:GAF domain